MSAWRAEDLGQLLFVTLDDHKWTSACERALRRYQPGGVLLAQRNLRTPQATFEMLREIARALDTPPFLALEEEGGTVDPLRTFFPPLPSPRIAAVKGLKRVERLGSLIGEALALLGFNVNFAPRLDLANPLVNPSLQSQFFSSDAQVVAECGESFVRGLRRHKILACGKHFPGFSPEEKENECPLPIVDKPMTELWREDMMPFRQSLPGLGLVTMSFAAYKAYDLDLINPASLSANVIGGLLRVKLGYRGVVVADYITAMREIGVISNVGLAASQGTVGLNFDAFAKSVTAGCDMLAVGWSGRIIEPIVKILKEALDAETLSAGRVCESANRIRKAKKGLRLPTGKFPKRAYDRLCREFEEFSRDCKSAERESV